jgi:hypothetical protein
MSASGRIANRRTANGLPFDVGTIPYDPVEHRRWEIAQRGAITTWSVASATSPFHTIQQFENLPITHVSPNLSIGCTQAGCAASFDNVGDGGPIRGTACSVNSQRDDFAAEEIDYTQWHPFSGICTWSQVAGQLVASYVPSATGACFFETSTILDASAGTFAVEVVDIGSVKAAHVSAFAFDDHEIRFERSNGMLIARDGNLMVPPFQSTPFDPVAHRWWRFRGKPEGMVFEVSSNGSDYNFFAQTGNLGALDRTRFRLGVEGDTTGTVVFDNVNSEP